MNIYLDTSVLVAARASTSPRHGGVLNRLGDSACSAPTVRERSREPDLLQNGQAPARQMIERSVLPRAGVIALTAAEYRQVIDECADGGFTGGMVYDAIHIRSARKAECERLYTLNTRDFRALAAEDLRDRISAP